MKIIDAITGCFEGVSATDGLILGLFMAGLVGSLSHCVAMCGPFVISQNDKMEKLRDSFLVFYHAGRITTYMVMAFLLASVLNIVFLYLPVRSFVVAPVLMLAGLIFLMNAFPRHMKFLKDVFPWLAEIHLPFAPIQKAYSKIQSIRYVSLRRFMMGNLLGFMPCGLATSALLASASAPTAWQAAMAMGAFGLGTVPALMATSMAGHALKSKFPHIMPKVTQVAMVWSGLWLFIMAGLMLI